jgi:hypothetical protein
MAVAEMVCELCLSPRTYILLSVVRICGGEKQESEERIRF